MNFQITFFDGNPLEQKIDTLERFMEENQVKALDEMMITPLIDKISEDSKINIGAVYILLNDKKNSDNAKSSDVKVKVAGHITSDKIAEHVYIERFSHFKHVTVKVSASPAFSGVTLYFYESQKGHKARDYSYV